MKPLYQRSAALALASVFTLWGAAVQANSVASSNGAALADIAIQSNWGAGYCAAVTITNKSSAVITSWQAQINPNNSQITNVWSGTLSSTSVSGAGYNNQINVGGSVSFGFCGNATGTNFLPTLSGLTIVGGAVTSSVSSAVVSSSSALSSVAPSSAAPSSIARSSIALNSIRSSSSLALSSVPLSSKASSVAISSSIASSVVSSAATQCKSSCNWYGTLYPVCQQQTTNWGWESNASCIGSATCSAQPAGYGVVSNCSSRSVVSSASLASSSVVISSSLRSSSSSSQVPSSVLSSSLSSLVSSSVIGSSSSAATNQIPNAASNGFPYCRSSDSDPDGDGWGWENSYSCIVKNSAADSGVGSFAYCVIGAEKLTLCATDTGSWGSESGKICLSKSMCPGMGSVTQTAMSTAPVNANANATTRKVFTYLKSIWGNHVLSGQMDLNWQDAIDQYQRALNDTGRAPAIMGFDFMNYGLYWNGISGITQTEEAVTHWNRGGLVTFTWHWRDPDAAAGAIGDFYTEKTAFKIPIANGVLDTASPSFTHIEANVAMIAAELKKLQDAGVTVLWRPLHEASGGWFWWGRSDRTDGVPPAYAQVVLWKYMYNRLTNYYGLNNLIWVWNGQSGAWYPGDNYVDIVSTDIYDGAKNYKSQVSAFNLTKSYPHQAKMVAMSENSNIPDPDLMAADGAWWLYFMVWNDVDTPEGETNSSNFWTGEYYNTNTHKSRVYNHNLVITLDELPNFKN